MYIRGNHIWIGSCFIPAVMRVEDGRIIEFLDSSHEADIDYADKRVLPGFIDIHTHGAYGFDTDTADPEGLRNWKKKITGEGVTSFLATTVTEKKEILLAALRNVAAVKKENAPGADLLGVHFEGPFLDMKYRGAQPPEAIVSPSVEEFRQFQEAAEGLIRIITLAVEHDKDLELTRWCASHGVIVSIGHSGCTFAQAALASANGARSVTHTYNGMSPFNHRENGLVGAALRLDHLYGEIICDCNHSTPEALNLFFRMKGKEKAVMISDSLMCKGFAPGDTFVFGGHEVVIYPDGSAHLVKEKNLAGSTLKINEGLRSLVEKALVPFDAALNSCTANPAALLGETRIGRLAAGYDADITVLDDDYSVIQTWCKGNPCL